MVNSEGHNSLDGLDRLVVRLMVGVPKRVAKECACRGKDARPERAVAVVGALVGVVLTNLIVMHKVFLFFFLIQYARHFEP